MGSALLGLSAAGLGEAEDPRPGNRKSSQTECRCPTPPGLFQVLVMGARQAARVLTSELARRDSLSPSFFFKTFFLISFFSLFLKIVLSWRGRLGGSVG